VSTRAGEKNKSIFPAENRTANKFGLLITVEKRRQMSTANQPGSWGKKKKIYSFFQATMRIAFQTREKWAVD
jgi:hypothetical protein